MNKRYGVVGRHPWNRKHFEQCLHGTPGEWHFAGTPEELQRIEDDADSYRYLFFLHWSDKVPSDLLQRVECVCFHMTDVPFGRGGSPLQNLIVGGFRETKLTALRMTPELDGGPVYLKVPLSLEGGTAEEIYQRVSRLSCELALRIAAGEPLPERQQGAPVVFRRRRPEDSAIPDGGASLENLFDHIRMLDAEGYPAAFIDHGPFRLTFRRAACYHGRVQADVSITLRSEPTTADE